jgi:2',3'-cyclic-nucleotide 2'-phosphodiesterase (5'-nucleotidase family)
MGKPRVVATLKTIRSECIGSVLVLDNGDTFHGTHPSDTRCRIGRAWSCQYNIIVSAEHSDATESKLDLE